MMSAIRKPREKRKPLRRIARMAEITRPKSLTDHAYERLKAAIRSGALEPHRFYPLGEIAQNFGISRTPVREAVLKLAHDGLLEILPQRGFRIREVGPEEMAEVFELRGLIEARTVENLAKKGTAGDIQSLRSILKRQERVVHDVGRFLDVDEEFHLTMLERAGLRRAREFMVTLRDIIWLLGLEALALPGRLEEVLAEHRRVVDAIERKDVTGARRAIESHLTSTYAKIGLASEKRPSPAR